MRTKPTILLTLFLALLLLAACGGGSSGGGKVTPDSIGLDLIRAVAAGDTTKAEKLLVANADADLKGKVQNAIQVLGRYDVSQIEVASSREWTQDATDRRVEIRFQFKPKGTGADEPIKIGLVTIRTVASGGLHSVGDVILDRPTE
ncbi:MAG: hypothetical protein IT330_12480 [Anaerolineae bacterium]|nr:hypothetical protein [Anaerolineae bacterium]